MAPEEEEEEEAQLLPQGREAEGSEGQSRLATCADQARGPALSRSNLCASRAGTVLSKIAHSGGGVSGKSLPSQKLKRGYSSPTGGWNRTTGQQLKFMGFTRWCWRLELWVLAWPSLVRACLLVSKVTDASPGPHLHYSHLPAP